MFDNTADNFAYLDERTKRLIRRATLKGFAIPGDQVPFASREMPMPCGWGTGDVQVSVAVLTPDDRLKVVDQGAEDIANRLVLAQMSMPQGLDVGTLAIDDRLEQTMACALALLLQPVSV